MQSYRELEVWKLSMQLAHDVYFLTNDLPKSELYSLTSQIRRAVVSVSANIAEGYGRNNRGEYIQFLGIATGSLCELETLLYLADDLYQMKRVTELVDMCRRIGQMLRKLKESLR